MAKSTAPIKAEANGDETAFEFDGRTYVVPPVTEWDVDAIEAVEDGRMATACRALLGEEQWRAFKSRKRTVADLRDLYQTIEAALGTEGN